MTESAGTTSPTVSKAMSPGTTLPIAICCFLPDLITVVFTSTVLSSSSTVLLALNS